MKSLITTAGLAVFFLLTGHIPAEAISVSCYGGGPPCHAHGCMGGVWLECYCSVDCTTSSNWQCLAVATGCSGGAVTERPPRWFTERLSPEFKQMSPTTLENRAVDQWLNINHNRIYPNDLKAVKACTDSGGNISKDGNRNTICMMPAPAPTTAPEPNRN